MIATIVGFLGPMLIPGVGLGAGAIAFLARLLFGSGGVRQTWDAHRGLVTMIAVATAAAALYVWGAAGRAERDQLTVWAEARCASAGASFAPSRGLRGQACAAAIADLARFKIEAAQETSRVLLEASRDRETKSEADARSARAAAQRAANAQIRMEAANAAVQDDHVGGDWFAAFNHLAGLRRP